MNSRWKFETFQFGKCSITRWKDNLRRLASDTTLTALSLMYTAPGDDLKRELGGHWRTTAPSEGSLGIGYQSHFWPLYGHAATGVAATMSERRPGVSRWCEGVGFGVGAFTHKTLCRVRVASIPWFLCC
jgi:hypothetical protein